MPRKYSWLLRIPQIRAMVSRLAPGTELDAAALGELFGVDRRQAQRLMRSLGLRPETLARERAPSQLGRRPLAVTRERLLARLDAPRTKTAHTAELERRSRLADEIATLRRDVETGAARIRLRPWPRDEVPFDLDRLPEGTHLEPGRLHVRFTSVHDLVQQLFDLSLVLRRNWQEAEQRLNPGPPPTEGYARSLEQRRAYLRSLGIIK